ncbi:MAG TPA: AIR synthase related protein, partial [Candidatus Polarisedimenticolaceae bacterium]|nr:AIR synthase related protein [Candidatus Polarisedimenticolaceae bacterium]
MRRLRDVGEHAWIRRWIPRLARERTDGVLLGPGDDAAVVRLRRPALVTTDTLIDGVHFRRSWLQPAALGRRAFGVNASDVAAMGGTPRFAVLAL